VTVLLIVVIVKGESIMITSNVVALDSGEFVESDTVRFTVMLRNRDMHALVIDAFNNGCTVEEYLSVVVRRGLYS
jgi:hypothetical protein